uniref:Rubisco LSMT substrate-binding domain-containing protein n=1 Tax=Lotharella oceanica TaxID=641309 RepID=A0A7S2XH27_9EUKA
MLHASSIRASIEGLQECLKREYETLSSISSDFQRITLDEFKWARMLISSRAFRLTVKGREIRVLGPLVDLMDHAEKRRTTWKYDASTDALTVCALEDFRVGEEIRCHYGKKSAKKFLLYYGFTPDETLTGAYDHLNDVEFVMFVHPDFPEAKAKQRLVNEEYACKKYSVDTAFTRANTLEALSFMRLLCASGEEEMTALPKQMSKDYSFRETPIQPMSIRNEVEVLRMLSNMMKEQHSHYSDEMRSRAGASAAAAAAAAADQKEDVVSGGDKRKRSTNGGPAYAGRKRARVKSSSASLVSSTSSSLSSESEPPSSQRSAETVIVGEMAVCSFYISLAEAVIPALEGLDESTLTVDAEGLSGQEKEYVAYVCYSLQVRRKAKLDAAKKRKKNKKNKAKTKNA